MPCVRVHTIGGDNTMISNYTRNYKSTISIYSLLPFVIVILILSRIMIMQVFLPENYYLHIKYPFRWIPQNAEIDELRTIQYP